MSPLSFSKLQKKKKDSEGGGGSRKRKAGKDPNKPKRPQSAYFIWLNETRESIKEEFPGISVTDLSKKAGERWKEVKDKTVSKKKKRNYLRSPEMSAHLQCLLTY